MEKFLSEGSKVKVTIMFRGREMQHPELGRRILDNVADAVVHVGNVEFEPNQEGRNMVMVLGPDKKKIAALKKANDAAAAEAAAQELNEQDELDEPIDASVSSSEEE